MPSPGSDRRVRPARRRGELGMVSWRNPCRRRSDENAYIAPLGWGVGTGVVRRAAVDAGQEGGCTRGYQKQRGAGESSRRREGVAPRRRGLSWQPVNQIDVEVRKLRVADSLVTGPDSENSKRRVTRRQFVGTKEGTPRRGADNPFRAAPRICRRRAFGTGLDATMRHARWTGGVTSKAHEAPQFMPIQKVGVPPPM